MLHNNQTKSWNMAKILKKNPRSSYAQPIILHGTSKNPAGFWKYLDPSLHTLNKKSTSWHYHKSIIQWLFPAMLIHFIPILGSFQVFPLTDWKIIKDVFQLFDHLRIRSSPHSFHIRYKLVFVYHG